MSAPYILMKEDFTLPLTRAMSSGFCFKKGIYQRMKENMEAVVPLCQRPNALNKVKKNALRGREVNNNLY